MCAVGIGVTERIRTTCTFGDSRAVCSGGNNGGGAAMPASIAISLAASHIGLLTTNGAQ